MRVLPLIAGCFTLAGMVLLGFSAPEYVKVADLLARASAAEGQVTEVIPRTSTDRKGHSYTTYYYRVRFQTRDGVAQEFVNAEGHSSPTFAPGETVPVLYNPAQPDKAALHIFHLLWFNFALLAVVGGALLGAGSIALWITAVPARGFKGEVTLPELRAAWRAGKLTRSSPYQGMLVALTWVGFALLAPLIMLVFFAGPIAQTVVGLALAWGVFNAGLGIWRGRRAKR